MYLDKVNAVHLTTQIKNSYLEQLSLETIDIQRITYNENNTIVDENDINSNVEYEEYRYIGTSPNNYIYFNCDDFTGDSSVSWYSSHCEKWQIIGIMDENTTGNSNELVKIIRDSIGRMAWDYKKMVQVHQVEVVLMTGQIHN